MKVGIIGAGMMGQGIAQTFATLPEHEVVLCDLSGSLAQSGKQNIAAGLKRLVQKGKMDQSNADLLLQRVSTGTLEAVSDCDLIVEAIVEKTEAKIDIFRKLDEICKKDTIFATNTSSLSITEISTSVKRPVVGMHFFSPAPVMKLVEVIRGLDTPDEIAKSIVEVATKIGKTPVEVRECPGFIVNRILIPMINEAICVYSQGVATVEDIDTAMKLGANHPIGPLALGDRVGLDVCLAIMENLQNETGDPKYRPDPLLRKMVRGGLLGYKSGSGFYQYNK